VHRTLTSVVVDRVDLEGPVVGREGVGEGPLLPDLPDDGLEEDEAALELEEAVPLCPHHKVGLYG